MNDVSSDVSAIRHDVLSLSDAEIRSGLDPFANVDGLPSWLVASVRMIRPICVGALMAIPTVGAATVGSVALVSPPAAEAAVRASTGFLVGIPTDIVLLIGALATGYSLSKTVERIKGVRA